MKTHYLKIKQEYYDQITFGQKPFEIRLNDRDYKKGDRVLFYLVDENGNSVEGNHIQAQIGYVCDYKQINSYVVFGLVDIYLVSSTRNKKETSCQ